MSAAVWTAAERAEFIAAAKAAISGPAATDAAAQPTPAPARRRGGKLNAGMSVTSILAALSRVGWGPLRGREFAASRAILDTLSLIAHDSRTDLTAVIQTTARQLAKRAGYSLRHTSRCLQWLEDAGVIVWNRGGIRAGAPTVGFIKVIKRTLVDWALAFRRASDAEDRRRNAETRARLQFYRVRRNTARPKPIDAAHEDMGSPHPSLRDEGASHAAPHSTREEIVSPTKEEKTMPTKYKPTYSAYMPATCSHGEQAPDRCNQCRYQAIMRSQRAAEESRLAAERRRKEEEAAAASQDPESVWPPAFVAYMHATYPDAHLRSWARLMITDTKAKELFNA
jgi:hypothetical protein